jgi:hypothetical protein
LIAACGGGGASKPATDIVSVVPWKDSEKLTYVLSDKSGRQTATGTFTVTRQGAQTVLTQSYVSGGNTDETSVTVDSQTLKPISSRRVIEGTDEQTIEVTYTEQGALIRQGERQSGLSVPEHAYDNDTSLFLWRTIDFREGYTARYVTIITNRRSRQDVDLTVTGRESVSVPAGQFNAWRLEIKPENARQVAWFADTPERTLLKYDNDRGTVWELQTKP